MNKQTYSLAADATLVLTSCGGQIKLVGGEQDHVILKGTQAPETSTTESALEMGPLHGTYKVIVPRETPVTIQNAAGDLDVRRVAGDVTVETAHGNLSLRDLAGVTTLHQAHGQLDVRELNALRLAGTCHGNVSLRRVGELDLQEVHGNVRLSYVEQAARIVQVSGDLRVDDVTGPLTIDEVDGNLRARRVAGRLFVNHVGGDLVASHLAGGASVEEVGGSIIASIDPAPGQEYRFRAYGDVVLKVPPAAHVRLEAVAPAGRVRNDLTLDVEEEEGHRLVGVMNAPEEPAEPATVILVSAGGNVRLRLALAWDQEISRAGEQFGQEMGRWGEQFGQEMGRWGQDFGREMGRVGQEIGREITSAFGSVDTERVVEHATETAATAQIKLEHRLREIDVNDLASKAEAAAAAGIAWAQEAMSRAMSRLEQEGHISRDKAPSLAAMADDTSRQEEKLAILKMIETGRITAAEGEMLLDALED